MARYSISYYFPRPAPPRGETDAHADLLRHLITYMERAGATRLDFNGGADYINIEFDCEDRTSAFVIVESAFEAAAVPAPGWPTADDIAGANVASWGTDALATRD